MDLTKALKFDKNGLIPAVIVDAASGQVLVLCYMNEEAVRKTFETGKVYVFRRSKNRLMVKGETSGHVQLVKEVLVDCEGNSLVIKVEQKVAACHAGYFSCYYRRLDPKTGALEIIARRVFDPGKVY
jgi:phosphoribosyl-AMP cyclohydrolase